MSETTPLSPGLCASGLLLDGPGTAARLEDLGHRTDDAVAHQVPPGVVDRFEEVDIDHMDRQRVATMLGASALCITDRHERAPMAQAGG